MDRIGSVAIKRVNIMRILIKGATSSDLKVHPTSPQNSSESVEGNFLN